MVFSAEHIWSFPVSCITSKVDNRPACQAAVQWKWHFKVSVRKSEVTSSSVWLFSGWNINTSANLSQSCIFLTRRTLTREDISWAGAFSCASLSEMNRMEMGRYRPAWTPVRSIVLHGAGGQIRRLSLQRPQLQTHTLSNNSPESPSVDFYVFNLTIVITPRLALYFLLTYESDLDRGQICPWFPPHVVDRRCYVILHHRRGFESCSSGDWMPLRYLLVGERPAATGSSYSSRLLVST